MHSTSWIGSLDVDVYVKKLMGEEKKHIEQATKKRLTQLTNIQTGLQTKISAFGRVQNYLDTFKTNLDNLQTAFDPTFTPASSDQTIATVELSGGSVAAGTHSLQINNMAQSQSIASKVFSDPNADLTMTNTITITIGSGTLIVPVNPGDSLQNVADKIVTGASLTNVGVTASVFSTGAGSYQLRIDATQSGVDNAPTITETGTGSNALSIDTSGSGTVLTAAKNASFIYDSLPFNTPTNVNVIAGLSITLVSETGNATLSVTNSNNVSGAVTAVENVINSYNDIMNYIATVKASNNAYDPATGALTRSSGDDPVFSQIRDALQSFLSRSVVLANLGINPVPYDEVDPISFTNTDGTPGSATPTGLLQLGINLVTGESLTDLLNNDFSAIAAQLVSDNGVFASVNGLLTPVSGDVWKMINDADYGAWTNADTELSDVTADITEVKKHAEKEKDKLLKKYGQLDYLLTMMQVQSQMMSQQIEVMLSR